MKKILSAMRVADKDFGLIADGDRIAVGVSGGKDSMTLLLSLYRYRQYTKKQYDLACINIDMGFPGFDNSPIAEFCDSFEIPFLTRQTGAYRLIFEKRRERHPCSLCANIRRGAVNNLAAENGYNKVALGHHRDDALETFLLCMLQEMRLKTLQPISHLSRSGVTVIRPLLYVTEAEIRAAAQRFGLPILPSGCPVDGVTRREDMKKLLGDIEKTAPRAREYLLGALRNTEKYDLWDRYMQPEE